MLQIDKKFNNDSINVVFGTNNKYAKYLTVAIQSLVENAADDRNYDIIVFETDVVDEMKETIQSIAKDKENISIRFLNVNPFFESFDSDKLFCHLYFTKEMYLRIFIPDILKNYDKAIYLDCDIIVKSDLKELFDIDIKDYYLAAANDFNSIVNIYYYPKVDYYFNKVLQFKDMGQYFNSGVLLMNLPVLREVKLVEKTLEILDKHKELLYPDQDVLNLICEGKTKLISNSWNFVTGINAALVQDSRLVDYGALWTRGFVDQRILHFISEHKPWDVPEMSYADTWWKYAKKSPVYQILLKEYFDAHPEKLK